MQQLICFLGRFQPWHNGHMQQLRFALDNASNVLILCGSANSGPSQRNPWSFEQRVDYINSCLNLVERRRVLILPIIDYLYNHDRWLLQIQQSIVSAKKHFALSVDFPVAWVGHHKDHTCYYLDDIAMDKYYEQPMFAGINASDVRADIHALDFESVVEKVPLSVVKNIMLTQVPWPCADKEYQYVLVFICKENVMFLKGRNGLHLPNFPHASADLQETILSNFASTWYQPEQCEQRETISFKHEHRSDDGRQVAIARVIRVNDMLQDTGVVWLNIYRFKDYRFIQDHASIAFNIIDLLHRNAQ